VCVVVCGTESAAVRGVVGVESDGYEFAACVWVVVGYGGPSVAPVDGAGGVALEYGPSECLVCAGSVDLVVYSFGACCGGVGWAASAASGERCWTAGYVAYLHAHLRRWCVGVEFS
jgi:hypothetical protein